MKVNTPKGSRDQCDSCGKLSEKPDEFQKFNLLWRIGNHPVTDEILWNGIGVSIGGVHVPVDLKGCSWCWSFIRIATAQKSLRALKELLPTGPLKTLLTNMDLRGRLPNTRLLRQE